MMRSNKSISHTINAPSIVSHKCVGKQSILNQIRVFLLIFAIDGCWEHTTLNFKPHISKLNPFAGIPKIQTIRSDAAEANLFKHWMTSCHPFTSPRPGNNRSSFLPALWWISLFENVQVNRQTFRYKNIFTFNFVDLTKEKFSMMKEKTFQYLQHEKCS